MVITVKIINYTQANLKLRSELDEVTETKIPTCIISKNNQVVLVGKDEYDEMVRELEAKK